MDMATALDIMAKARSAFYERTTNKLFDKSNTDPAALPDTPRAIQAATQGMEDEVSSDDIVLERKRELEKAIARNKSLEASDLVNLRAKNPDGYCPFERGKRMFNRSKHTKAAGNCLEQSDVAVFLSCKADKGSNRTTYLVKVNPPGDHGFCIVGASKKPSWTSVESMSNDVSSDSIIVIDPWMHFVCKATEYPRKASEKMQQWLGRGKRIFWNGNDTNSSGWYQPGGDYVARFLDSKLSYESAGGYG